MDRRSRASRTKVSAHGFSSADPRHRQPPPWCPPARPGSTVSPSKWAFSQRRPTRSGELSARALKAGLEARVATINRRGGIAGRYPIELVYADTNYDPSQTATQLNATKDRVVGYAQILGTPNVEAVEPLLRQNQLRGQSGLPGSPLGNFAEPSPDRQQLSGSSDQRHLLLPRTERPIDHCGQRGPTQPLRPRALDRRYAPHRWPRVTATQAPRASVLPRRSSPSMPARS